MNDHGEVVGLWSDDPQLPLDTTHGFIRDRHGRFTSFDAPGSSYTDPQGVNDQLDVAGVYEDDQGRNRGFIRDRRGRVTTIDLSDVSTSITGIDNRRQMVGAYVGTDGIEHGFLLLRYRSGRFASFDGPGPNPPATLPLDINERREVVGFSVTLTNPAS